MLVGGGLGWVGGGGLKATLAERLPPHATVLWVLMMHVMMMDLDSFQVAFPCFSRKEGT